MRLFAFLLFSLLYGAGRLAAQPCSLPENPAVLLRVAVDQLRLRSQPGQNAPVRLSLPENKILLWCGESSQQQDTITLRGRKVVDRWYLVYVDEPLDHFFDDSPESMYYHENDDKSLSAMLNDQRKAPYSGWVFGGGVVLYEILFGSDQAFHPFQTPWAEMTLLSMDSFRVSPENETLMETEDPGDTLIVLPLHDGRTVTIADAPKEWEESQANYVNLGYLDLLDGYLIEGRYWESHDMKIIGRTKGDTLLNAPFAGRPCFSPDQRHFLMPFSNYGGSNSNLTVYAIDRKKFEPAWYLFENQESGVLHPYWESPDSFVFQSIDWKANETKKVFRVRFRPALKE